MRLLLLAALLGLAGASQAQTPNPPAKSEQTQPAQTVGNGNANVAIPDHEAAERRQRAIYEAECNPPNEERDSDLCAQWKAADAAAESAYWARWAAWVGGVSILLVLGALALAFQSNRIARDTARRQLRAYITLHTVALKVERRTGAHFALVTFKNDGQTPATDVEIATSIFVAPANAVIQSEIEQGVGPSTGIVGAGGEFHFRRQTDGTINAEHVALVTAGTHKIILGGVITYKDIFKESRETLFQQSFDPESGAFHPDSAGNKIT